MCPSRKGVGEARREKGKENAGECREKKRQRGKKESREEGERGKAEERGRRKQIPYQCFSIVNASL